MCDQELEATAGLAAAALLCMCVCAAVQQLCGGIHIVLCDVEKQAACPSGTGEVGRASCSWLIHFEVCAVAGVSAAGR